MNVHLRAAAPTVPSPTRKRIEEAESDRCGKDQSGIGKLFGTPSTPSSQREASSDSPTLAAHVPLHSSTFCSIGFTEECVLYSLESILSGCCRNFRKEGRGLHFPQSNSWQSHQLIADLISIISS